MSDTPNASSEARKTTVTVGITRTLNTAQFESLQVCLQTSDEIVWTTPQERDTKTQNLAKKLTKQYLDTQSQVLDDLGVQEKRAWRKQPKQVQTSNLGDELLA